MSDYDDLFAIARDAAWQFNEAVSLLREARGHLAECDCAEDIDDGLPAMDAALRTLAAVVSIKGGRS